MAFTGKSFLRGVEHLEIDAREQYERHGTCADGRWTFVEQIVEEAMIRMARSKDGADGE
jgi:hypothetical protein